MSDSSQDTYVDNPTDRRRFFRIDDTVSMELRKINRQNLDNELALFEQRREKFCLMNNVAHEKERHLPDRRLLEKSYPEVLRYLDYLEARIDMLSKFMVKDQKKLYPDQRVNISAQGMRFFLKKSYAIDDLVEVSLIFHPGNICLLAISTVVWCEEDEAASEDERYALAIDFTYINDADREALVKHIHQLQLKIISDEKNLKELDAE